MQQASNDPDYLLTVAIQYPAAKIAGPVLGNQHLVFGAVDDVIYAVQLTGHVVEFFDLIVTQIHLPSSVSVALKYHSAAADMDEAAFLIHS